MKTMDVNPLKKLGEKVPFVGEQKTEEVRTDPLSGVTLRPHVIQADEAAQEGDMMVVYHSREAMLEQYRRAIRALDLNETEQEHLLDPDRLDTFRQALEYRLEKTKLWNYAPEQREEVKAARAFLQTFLRADIPYAETLFVPGDEMEAFLADETLRFGAEEYYYCVNGSGLDLGYLRERVSELGHELEERIEALIFEPVHHVQQLGERAIGKIPSATIPQIRLMSA